MAPRAPTEYRELLHGLLQGSYTDITFHDVLFGSRLPLLFRLFQRRFCSVYMCCTLGTAFPCQSQTRKHVG